MDLTFTLLTKHNPTHTLTQTLITPTDHQVDTAMEATSPEHSWLAVILSSQQAMGHKRNTFWIEHSLTSCLSSKATTVGSTIHRWICYSQYGASFRGGFHIHIADQAPSNSHSYSDLGYSYRPLSGYSYRSNIIRTFPAVRYTFKPD